MKEIIKTIFESDIVNEALNVYIPNEVCLVYLKSLCGINT